MSEKRKYIHSTDSGTVTRTRDMNWCEKCGGLVPKDEVVRATPPTRGGGNEKNTINNDI